MWLKKTFLIFICSLTSGLAESLYANSPVISGLAHVHVNNNTTVSWQPTKKATGLQLFIKKGTPTKGLAQVTFPTTPSSPQIFVAEGTKLAGFDQLKASITYLPKKTTPTKVVNERMQPKNTPQAKTKSAKPTRTTHALISPSEDLPCLPPMPIPHPKEQGNQVISNFNPLKLSLHPPITKNKTLFYASFILANQQALQPNTHHLPTSNFIPTYQQGIPFVNGFSGLAPPA